MWGCAHGLVAFLEEDEAAFRVHGIKELLKVVESEWPMIAEDVEIIENLANDETFEHRHLAAFLASKTFYYMGRMGAAVRYALLSGEPFDPDSSDTYVQRIVSHTIHQYIKKMNAGEKPAEGLQGLVRKVLEHLMFMQKYGQCLCLAIETRFLEFVHQSMQANPELVTEAIKIADTVVTDSEYRQLLLREFVAFAKDNCDKVVLSQLHHALRDPEATAQLLISLKQSSDMDNWLIAYQIAFELAENAAQVFRSQVINMLPEEMTDMKDILMRKKLLELYLSFLYDKCDPKMIQIINGLKESVDLSYKLIHTSVVLAYSYIYAGTGIDKFYRDNVQWFFGKESDWAEFLTIAAIGTIHNGRLSAAQQLLQPYLKQSAPMHSLGGGLYALGLIYANYIWDDSVIQILTNALSNTASSVVKHGACLGLGLVALGSHNPAYYSQLSGILNEEDPVSGEAAAYALGLVMLGAGLGDELQEFLSIVSNSKHEKITRGGAMGLAFMMYGKQEQAEVLVQELLVSRVPLLRESAAWVTALAYVGTASNDALQRLLHLAISDVNAEVRRAAIIGIGFVLSKNPKEVPSMIDLLARSYNPAVRNGAALALGIACAGTGMKEAIAILEPMLKDIDHFVTQSAMIAMAMVLQQQSDEAVPYCKEFRQYLRKFVNKRTKEIGMWGVAMAYGILNAGGRNTVISCNTLGGENCTLATVGLAMFCNYYYWHPLSLMLTLAFHPTAIIGVDVNLQVPEWTFFSSASRSLFADPPSFDEEKVEVTIGAARALSITKKAPEGKKAEGEEKKEEVKAEGEEKKEEVKAEGEEKKEETPEGEEKKEEQPEGEEPRVTLPPPSPSMDPETCADFQTLKNASRVTKNQLSRISLDLDFFYAPITKGVRHGIVMLKKLNDE